MTRPVATGANGRSAEIVFVDARTPDHEAIIAGFQGAQVVWIESDRDGVEQIRDALAGRAEVSAVHLVGHGDAGVMLMGSGALHSGNIADYGQALAEIGQALSEDGDIHLWGCDVGAGETGAAFIQGLAEATGADIAASADATGGAHLGGDWALEITTGAVAASNAINAEALADADIHLATFSVASLAELKAALGTAASNGVADIITLTGNITAAGQGDFTSGYLAAVNLAESHALTIVGGGFTLDANYFGGVLSISAGDNVEIQNLTIRGGLLDGDGGNAPAAGGNSLGAGVSNLGALTLRDVTVTQNAASGGGGGGGVGGATSAAAAAAAAAFPARAGEMGVSRAQAPMAAAPAAAASAGTAAAIMAPISTAAAEARPEAPAAMERAIIASAAPAAPPATASSPSAAAAAAAAGTPRAARAARLSAASSTRPARRSRSSEPRSSPTISAPAAVAAAARGRARAPSPTAAPADAGLARSGTRAWSRSRRRTLRP